MAIITLSKCKTLLQIDDNDHNELIRQLIPLVEEDYLTIRNCDFDEDSNGIMYPNGAELVAAQMIGFQMSPGQKTGGDMKSESVGGYSYSKDDMLFGYPKSIVGRINRYVSTK